MMKKYILTLSLFSLIAFISCERYLESKDPVRSLPSDVPAPENVKIAINDQAVSLSWTISDNSDVDQYRIYVSQTEPNNFQLHDSTATTSITINDLVLNQVYYFEIAAVMSSGLESPRSSFVVAQVGVMNMRINNNAEVTNNENVQIQFIVSNTASSIIFSEDSTFADTKYENYASTKNFVLSEGDGSKTIYADIIFANGAHSGEQLQASIELDTEANIDSVYYTPPGTTFAPGDTIIFGLDAGETDGVARASFTGASAIPLVDDGTGVDPIADDGYYHGRYIVPINTNLYQGLVTGNFTDKANNAASATLAFERLNINTPPEGVELVVTFESGTATFSWSASTEPDFASYRLYRSVDNNVNTDDILIFYGVGSGTRTFEYDPPSGNSWYRIMVYDDHGAYFPSNLIQITN